MAKSLAESTDERRFLRATQVSHDRIVARLDVYLSVLRAGSGLFTADRVMTRQSFRSFVEEMRLHALYPGMQGFGYAQRVAAADLPEFVSQARSEFPAFEVWPQHDRDEYYPIRYLEPVDARNQAAIGYDMLTETVRREAMGRAAATGAPAMSGKVTLAQEIDAESQSGFLIYVPVFRSRPEKRELQGFAYAPFRSDDLFGGIFGTEANPIIGFSVYDSVPEAENLLHRSASPLVHFHEWSGDDAITVAGRTWVVRYWATPAFGWSSPTWLEKAIPVAGGLLSLVIFFLSMAQVRGQRALIESEANTRAMFESALDAVMTIDADDLVTEWNPQAEAIFGWSRAEAVGRPLVDLIIPPKFRDAHMRGLRHYLATGEGPLLDRRVELTARRKDGSDIPVELSITASRVRGRIIFTGCLRDITERRRSEEAINESRARIWRSEQQLKLITDALPAMVSYIDANQRYRFINRAYQDWFGLNLHEIVGKTVEELVGPDIFARVRNHVRNALRGEAQHFEDTLTYPVYGRRSVQFDYVPDLDENGATRGFVSLIQDISQRRRAEEREHFMIEATAILNSSLDLDLTLSDLARLIVPRLADCCMIDLLEDGKLRSVATVHRDPDKIAFISEARRVYPVGRVHPLFLAMESPDVVVRYEVTDDQLRSAAEDERHLQLMRSLELRSVFLLPLRAHDRAIGIMTWMTVDKRKFSEDDASFAREFSHRAAVAIENAQLYASERTARAFAAEQVDALARTNAELEQFAYVSSHDLKEPLRMVTQYMGLLQMRYANDLPEMAKRYIAYASDGASRMQQLIDDLLAFSRSTRAEEAAGFMDTETVVANVLKLLKAQIESLHARVLVSHLPRLRMIESQLMQIFQNLISNGLKFHGEKPPIIEVTAEPSEGEWIFSVKDNGIGIQPEHRQRIFEVFQRLHTRDEYPGTGIGLAICKKLVERLGGRIWVESQPGLGSTFTFALPSRIVEAAAVPH